MKALPGGRSRLPLRTYVTAVVFSLTLAGSAARAQLFTFTRIADTSATSGLSQLGPQPSINNTGTVAFWARTGAGEDRIFTSNGGALTTVAAKNDVVSPSNGFLGGTISFLGFQPSINDGGKLAFEAAFSTSGSAVVTRQAGGSFSLIASSVPPSPYTDLGAFVNPVINNSGQVAFKAKLTPPLQSGGWIVYSSNGTTTKEIGSSISGGSFSSLSPSFPSINDAGTVVFRGDRSTPESGIYTGTGGSSTTEGPITTIVNTNNPAFNSVQTFGNGPSINDSGTVVFFGRSSANVFGIYKSVGGTISLIADGSGAYSGTSFSTVGLNINDQVAFSASLLAGGSGLFTGPNPVANKVIQTGDPLDGSTVTSISFGRLGLNDLGQMAFSAALADGRSGIYLAAAAVPEPSSLALSGLTAGLLALFHAWRKRRTLSAA